MNKKKYKVLVVGAFPPPLFGSALMNQYLYEIKDEEIKFNNLKLNFNKDFSNIEKFALKKIFILFIGLLKYLFSIWMYDVIVYTHSFRTSAFLKDSLFILISKIFGKKIILYAQGLNMDLFYERQGKILKKYIDFILSKVDYFVTVSKKQIGEYKRWTKNNISHIYNFVEVEDYNIKKEKTDKFRILFLSTLTEFKGVFTFLNAIDILERKNNNYQYILCGSFSNKNKEEKMEIQNFVKEHKDKVILKGRVEGYAKAEVFINADLYVFPTKNDSFGITNLEAMQYGLPIITTKQGAISEYFSEPDNGFFIKEDDAKSLAEKIEIIANDDLLRNKISNYNKIYVRQNFTRENFSKQWCSVIKEVIKK